MCNRDEIFKMLRRHEGFSSTLYKCPRGFNTIGYGFNLDSDGLPPEVADLWLKIIMTDTIHNLIRVIPWFTELDEARQGVLINMAYNVGIAGLLKFKKMLKALGDGRYDKAADEMKDSSWYSQVPNRANELISIMKSGVL